MTTGRHDHGEKGQPVSGCSEALARLQEYLDGEMHDAALASVSSHLADCFPCQDRADFERHLREVIRAHAAETAPAGLLDRVRQRCEQVDEQRRSGATEGTPPGRASRDGDGG